MYVCVCVCVYICVVWVYVCVYIYIYIYIYIYVYICMYICMCVYVCVRACICCWFVTNLGGNMARFTQFPLMITRSTIIYEIISPGAAGSSIYV